MEQWAEASRWLLSLSSSRAVFQMWAVVSSAPCWDHQWGWALGEAGENRQASSMPFRGPAPLASPALDDLPP